MIAGPTGVGKTDLALYLSKRLDGELISCDSVQVYKELVIGANKSACPQHLIDLVSWRDGSFTSATFYEACLKTIKV